MLEFLSELFGEPWLFLSVGLLIGVFFVFFQHQNPQNLEVLRKQSTGASKKLLQGAIILIGASLDIKTVVDTGLTTFLPNLIQITAVFAAGFLLGHFFGVNKRVVFLVTVGTAVCGGSAIAAVAPFLVLSGAELGLALSVVFALNAVGLFLFPALGHLLHMSQNSFGMWAALAIHDTSSVVGAATQFGSEALAVATVQKLTRALWLFPIALAVGLYRHNRPVGAAKPQRPWFMFYFLIMSVIFSYFEPLHVLRAPFALAGRGLLCLAIGLIGFSLDFKALAKMGPRLLAFGVGLWLVAGSLGYFLATHF